MTAIPQRGETPFEEGGDGVVLFFTNTDLKKIEAKFGKDWFDDFLAKAQTSMPSIEDMEWLIALGAKKDRKPVEVPADRFDEIPLIYLGNKILDAFCQSMKGMDLKAYLAAAFEAYVDATKDGSIPSPQSPDTTSSTTSVEKASGPAST